MRSTRTTPLLIGALALLAACGSDGDGSAGTTATTATPTTDVAVTTSGPATTTTTTGIVTTTIVTTTLAPTTLAPTTTEVVSPMQPAIWPAADVVFATPEEAAADFVSSALGLTPTLGDFVQGDGRSGEITLLSPGETVPVPRGTILLRQLGPDDGWFVLAIANDEATITSPESMAVVPAGPLVVEGVAHGFEASVVVTAFVAGDATRVLDTAVTMAGSMEAAGPYSVTLDLSGASAGDVVTLLVRGGTGLETDPGETGAIPVVIAGGSG